jgi:hypothetical protein
MAAKGECNCGAVRFAIDADLSGVFVCHCSICRRATGSNGIAVVIVPNGQFHWIQGEEHVTKWAKPNTSWEIFFCSICGSPVPGQNDANTMFVPAGTLSEGGETLKVIHHVWVNSKAVWDEIGDSGKQHPEGLRS